MSDFLKQVDAKLRTQATRQVERVNQEQGRRDAAEAFVQAAVPILEEFKQVLKDRNIGAEVGFGPEYFQFLMRYSNGKRRGFRFGRDRHSGGYVMIGLHADEHGRDFEGQGDPGGWSPQGEWSIDAFRKYGEGQILEFLGSGERNGGFKAP
jgi:hypothetical protein